MARASACSTRTSTARRRSPREIEGYASGVDIADYEAVGAAIADFERKVGPTDILVNNAGWDRFANFVDTTPDLWDQLIAINLRGPLNMSHFVLKGMVARGGGRIVNIASDAGRVGSSQEAVYSACKGGIIAFTKTVAREVARKGITLNAVCPGPTDTPLLAAVAGDDERGQKVRAALVSAIPMKRVGQPEDIPGRRLLPRQRRCGLHHRPDDQRLRRPHHAWLSRWPGRA